MTHWNDLSEQAKRICNITSNPNTYNYIIFGEIKEFEEQIRADERVKTIDILMDEVAQIKGISDEDWDLLAQKAEQMKGEEE